MRNNRETRDFLRARQVEQEQQNSATQSFISTGSDKVPELSKGRSVDELRAREGTADWLALRAAESISAGHACCIAFLAGPAAR